MDDNFSSRVKDVIAYSKEEALRLGHNFIGTEHLMLGMIRDGGGKAISILKSIEIDLDDLRKKVNVPIINMPEEVYNHAKKKCKIHSQIGILATEATLNTKIYHKYFNKNEKTKFTFACFYNYIMLR